MNPADNIPQRVRQLTPYQSARDIVVGNDYRYFDANEGTRPVVPGREALLRYPDPYAREIRQKLALGNALTSKNIFVGSGSDEIIDLLIKGLVDFPNERVLAVAPSYPVYAIFAAAYGVPCDTVLLNDDFSLDHTAIRESIKEDTKLVWLCSPNNPTGNRLSETEVFALCQQTDAFVVVDEAYVEFAMDESGAIATLAAAVKSYPNLIVLRTFSKAWGLAGVRCGWAAADIAVIEALDKVKEPYNVPLLTQQIVLEALGNADQLQHNLRQTIASRQILSSALADLGWQVYPSQANFVLVRLPDDLSASEVYQQLVDDYAMVVRDRSSQPLLANCLRISLGLPQDNQLLLEAIYVIIGK